MADRKKRLKNGGDHQSNHTFSNYSLTPQQIAVIIAILTDVLQVKAVILDVNKNVEIVLNGNLKSKEINHLLQELNNVPVEKWLNMIQNFK